MVRRKNIEHFVEGKTHVFRFKPLRDGKRRYIPFCDFSAHFGLATNYELCEERQCKFYRRLYL